jgi:hypothetical protein
MRKVAASSILSALLLVQSCGGTFATSLRAILASSGPLIESLNLGENKSKVVIGFTELADSAAKLTEAIKACAGNPCKLDAVTAFKSDFDRINARGVFGTHPKLQKVGEILDGIILSARIYYGARPPQTTSAGPVPPRNTKAELDEKLRELKAAMKP